MKKLAKKIFRPSSSGIASIILAGASLLSYILGLGRDILISNFFGANEVTDAYNTAFLIPDFIYTLTVAGALSGIFLPIFREEFNKNKDSGWELAGAFLMFSQIAVVIMSIIGFIAMPWLINTFFTDITAEKSELIINMSRILLVSPIIFTISNGLGTVLISFKHYLAYALSAAFYNGGIIFGIIFWHEQYGIYSAAFGVALGLCLHLGIRIIDMIQLWAHGQGRPSLKFWHPLIKKVYWLALPKTIGLLAWQFSLWAYNIIGYSLIAGSIAAFSYARNIQSFTVSLFGISIATAIFPFLVDFKSNNDNQALRQKLQSTLIQVLLYTLPAAAGLAIIAPETVQLLLGRGAFDATAIALTSSILFWFAFSIPFESLTHVMARAFYTYHNVIIPVIASLIFMTINITGSFYFAPKYGAPVFAIFFTISTLIQIIILLTIFHRKFLKLQINYLLIEFGKIISGTLIMSLTTYFTNKLPISIYPRTLITITTGIIVYLAWISLTDLLKYTGAKRFLNIFKR